MMGEGVRGHVSGGRCGTAGLLVLALVGCAGPKVDLKGTVWRPKDNPHPRIFVTAERIDQIRAQLNVHGSHHKSAYKTMRARVNSSSSAAYTSPATQYGRSYFAREAAFLALLAPDITTQRKYADMAFLAMKSSYLDEKQEKWAYKGYGLGRAMMCLGLAIPYDWCHNIWTEEQRAYMKRKITEALNAWPEYRHPNLGDVRGSNWAAVCRGGELVLMLCAGEEKNRAARYTFLKNELIQHIRNGFGDLGVSQEGLGYTEYPGGFLLPAVYACASIGDYDLVNAARTRNWWKLAMYTHSFQPHSRKFIMSGVGHSSNYDEGWASLLLTLVPEDQLPYFVWWYDRHMGRLAPGRLDEKFDAHRAGTVWSILYYPERITPRDPTGVYPFATGDSRGYYFFRNRWRDEDDILASIMADAHHHGHAWDKPEQLAINLMAYNTRYIGGPGKKGGGKEDPDCELFSTLLVDGKYALPGAVKETGRAITFEPSELGGYAVVGGGSLYEKLGVKSANRHMLAYLAMPGNRALFTTFDDIKSNVEHSYAWQANLGSEFDDDNIGVDTGREAGRPAFILAGRNESYVKGWVMHPADAIIEMGDPLRIRMIDKDANIWVVMLVGAGRPPTASITGSGLDGKLTVDGVTISYDRKDESLIAEE